jgi:hypothetical protein
MNPHRFAQYSGTRRRSLREAALSMLFAVALLSCGGSAPSPPAPVALEEVRGQIRQLICEQVFACCSPADLKNNPDLGNDVAACVAGLDGEATFLLADVAASVNQGRLLYRGDKMAACMAELKGRSCAEAKMPAGDKDVTQLCRAAFEPRVPIGGACSDYWDCIGGWCEGDIGNLQDHCAPLKPVGGDCDEGPECQSGVCGDDRVCEPRALGSGNICAIGTEVVGQHGTASEGRGKD